MTDPKRAISTQKQNGLEAAVRTYEPSEDDFP
jgi:hypothetical protein